MKLVGILGLIGSGKSTAGDVLEQEFDYVKLSFAGILKDGTSSLFGWPRNLLEGDTKESREFREIEDSYWTKALGRTITPRIILQEMGTEVIRNSFHKDFWIHALKQSILNGSKGPGPFVISDCRFENEMNFIKENGGILIRVKRGPDPEWFDAARLQNLNIHTTEIINIPVHDSEWKWIRDNNYYDYLVENDTTLEEFKQKIRNICKEIN